LAGNIRELQNMIERAVIVARSGALHFDLPLNNSDLTGKSKAPMELQSFWESSPQL
jgi:transcriptional regulator with AAA-type ATPase domain